MLRAAGAKIFRDTVRLVLTIVAGTLFLPESATAQAAAAAAAKAAAGAVARGATTVKVPSTAPRVPTPTLGDAAKAVGVTMTGSHGGGENQIKKSPLALEQIKIGPPRLIIGARREKVLPRRKRAILPEDPVLMVRNQSIVLNGVTLSPVILTGRRSLIIRVLKERGEFCFSCSELLLGKANSLPDDIARNSTVVKMSMRPNTVYVRVLDPGKFVLLANSFESLSPPPPPLPPSAIAAGGGPSLPPPPPPSPPQGAAPQGPTVPSCDVSGKVCYDPVKKSSSMSVSCGPVSFSVTSEGKMSVSMKVVG